MKINLKLVFKMTLFLKVFFEQNFYGISTSRRLVIHVPGDVFSFYFTFGSQSYAFAGSDLFVLLGHQNWLEEAKCSKVVSTHQTGTQP